MEQLKIELLLPATKGIGIGKNMPGTFTRLHVLSFCRLISLPGLLTGLSQLSFGAWVRAG